MKYILIVLSCFTIMNSALAQVKNLKSDYPYPTKYLSSDDTNLTLKTLTVAPAYDNVGGIYQSVADAELTDLISKDQFWAFSKFQWPESLQKSQIRADLIDEKPEIVQQILVATKANGMLSTVITKSAQGLSVHLTLHTQDGGLPLIQLSYQDPTAFEISKFKKIINNLYTQLKQKLPYKAFVTSRRGNKITINAGTSANLKTNDKLSVVQIIKINRHPKLKFMIGVEKEITGQIILNKVEQYSSFGEIVFEKEAGVIEKNSKILPPDFIQYQTLENSIQGTPMDSEKSADEWAPQAVPQFGKITLLGGFTDYKLSTVLTTGQAYDSGNSLSPTFHLGGELWITPQYFANISLEQLFFTGYNSLVGSSPANLSYTVNTMDLLFGYKYSLDGNFWGPSLLGSAGYISKSTKMSDSSPTAFSSFDTSGFQLQVGGYFPVTEKNDVGFGANVKYLLTTQFSESPVNSGSASPTLSQFDIYGNYSYTPNINFKGEIVFSAVNSTFGNGASRANPARSIEEKVTSYLLGIEYLF